MTQTNPFLSIAALVLAGALASGCAGSKVEIQDPEAASGKTVTFTTSVGLGNPASRGTLDLATGRKTFSAGDRIAVVYSDTGGSTVRTESDPLAEADIKDNGKTATITYTLTDPAANSPLRFVYPADMAKDDGSLNYDALSRQDGVQSALAGFDLAVYDGSLDEGTPSGPVVLQNQLTICTFTIQDEGGADLTRTLLSLTVSDGTNAYEVQAADQKAGFGFSPICVAVQPAEMVDFSFTAFDGTDHYFKLANNKSLAAGDIYPVSVGVKKVGLFLIGDGTEFLSGSSADDVLFGDAGVSRIKQRVSEWTERKENTLTDTEVQQFCLSRPDAVADWPGADNSRTDPNTGESLDGKEVLLGGGGADVLFGQGADDILFGDATSAAVANYLNIPANPSFAHVSVAIDAMALPDQKSFSDAMETAGDASDVLNGGDGGDQLFGLGGADTLCGGTGDDLLYGGGGDDTLYGGSGDDYLDGGAGADVVNGEGGSDIIRYDAADTIDGGSGIDILLGNSGDGSLAALQKVSQVEIFLRLMISGFDIDGVDLSRQSKLSAVLGIYFQDDSVSLSNNGENAGWNLNNVVTSNGITTITFSNVYLNFCLETTLQATVDKQGNEIVLTRM